MQATGDFGHLVGAVSPSLEGREVGGGGRREDEDFAAGDQMVPDAAAAEVAVPVRV